MPKLAGVNLVAVLLAAIAMFFIGFIFYGLLFSDVWMAARGYNVEMFEGQSPMWMLGGFLIELLLAFGIGWVLKRKSGNSVGTAVGVGFVLALLIAIPMLGYDFVYGAYHSVPGLMVDAGHTLLAFIVGSAIIGAMK